MDAYTTLLASLSPTAWWTLSDAAGASSAADASGGGHAGTPTSVTFGSSLIPAGMTETSAVFNGTSSIIATTETTTANNQTFIVWYKTSASGATQQFLDSRYLGGGTNNGLLMYLTSTGQLITSGYNSSGTQVLATDPNASNDGNWHMGALVYDGTNLYCYRDGNAVATTSMSGILAGTSMYLGAHSAAGGSPSNYVNGNMAQVAYFNNTALSPSQIASLYANGHTANLPTTGYAGAVAKLNPTYWWQLNDAAGSTSLVELENSNSGIPQTGVTMGANSSALPSGFGGATYASFSGGFIETTSAWTEPSPYYFTLSAWINTTSNTVAILEAGNQQNTTATQYCPSLFLNSTGQVVCGVYNGASSITVTSPLAVNTGQWVHVVATGSASGLVLYINGEQVAVASGTQAQSFTAYWHLGQAKNGVSNNFTGGMSQVAVWNSVLTAQQIATLYNASGLSTTRLYNVISSFSPTYWWQLNEPSGTTTWHEVNGSPATIETGTIVSSSSAPVGTNASVAMSAASFATAQTTTYSDTYTISFWINTTTAGPLGLMEATYNQTGTPTNWSDGIGYIDSTGKFNFKFNTGSSYITLTSTSVVNDGNWHCITMVSKPTTGSYLYIDGVAQATVPNYAGLSESVCYYRIGLSDNPSYPTRYTGNLTQVAIWHGTALSTSQIQSIYQAGSSAIYVSSISPSSGSINGGTTVTINGAGFTGATAVQFGTQNATSFTVVSDAQITATSPSASAAGSVDITVTAPVGTSTTGVYDQYYYYAPDTTYYARTVLATPNLQGYWPMNELAGTAAVDQSGNNNNGVFGANVTLGSMAMPLGMGSDKSVYVNGTSTGQMNVATLPSAMQNLTSNFTIEGWLYVTAATHGGFSYGNVGVGIGAQNDATGLYATVIYSNQRWIQSTAVTINAWHHIALVVSASGTPAIYVDGVQIYSDTSALNSYTRTSAQAGAYNGGDFFTGNMGHFALYNAPLSSGTIAAHYAASASQINITNVAPFIALTTATPTVTITGNGFTGATSVTIGGTAVTSFNVVSDTQITAVLPTGTAGTKHIQIVSPSGTSPTVQYDQFTYYASGSNPYEAALTSLSPLYWWKLQDATGASTVVDSSGNGNTGTPHSTITFGNTATAPANVPKYAQETSGGYISTTTANSPNVGSEILFFRTTGFSQGLMGSNSTTTTYTGASSRNLEITSQGYLQWQGWNSANNILTSPNSYNDGLWHLAVATYNASSAALYVDGQLVASAGVGTNDTTTYYWWLGANPKDIPNNTGPVYLTGSMAEVVVLPTAMSAGQVLNLYNAAGQLNQELYVTIGAFPASCYVGGTFSVPVTVKNISAISVAVGQTAVSGDSEFTIINDTVSNTTLTPGSTGTMRLQFVPTSAGTKTTSLSVPSADPMSPTTGSSTAISATQAKSVIGMPLGTFGVVMPHPDSHSLTTLHQSGIMLNLVGPKVVYGGVVSLVDQSTNPGGKAVLPRPTAGQVWPRGIK